MPKFAANLSMLFPEVDFMERFSLAAESGFQFVEYLFPYNFSAQELKSCLQENGLQQVLFNLPPGDWDAGERGIASHPDRVEEFKQGVDEAILYADALGVKQINCLSGLAPENIPEVDYMATLTNNLRYAAKRFSEANLTLLIEAINSRIDMPGFVIDNSKLALRLINEIEQDNIKLQYDIYHMQIMEGDIIRSIEKLMPYIGHIQFADNPGRHEPGTGELNFETIFKKLDEMGYSGWVSAEYVPSKTTVDTLGWLQSFN